MADTIMGPYEESIDTHTSALWLAVQEAHHADPQGSCREVALRHELAVCEAVGIEVGAFDRRILAWLSMWEPENVQAIVGLISRAHAAGVAKGGGGG